MAALVSPGISPAALRLSSKAFQPFSEIPAKYTADGANLSPPMKWSSVPPGTREFVLMCEDPDAPLGRPLLHWMIYHISANTTFLPEGLPSSERIEYPVLARQALNSAFEPGYLGPSPPPWHGPHRYVFTLFALNSELAVRPGATKSEVLRAMKGHVISESRLVGTYERRIRKKVRQVLGAPVTLLQSRSPGLQPLLTWAVAGFISAMAFHRLTRAA